MVYGLVFVPRISFTQCFKSWSLDMHDLKEARIGKDEVVWYHGELTCRSYTTLKTAWWIRLITLNGMKASEELTDEQSRHVYDYLNYLTIVWLYIPSWFLMWNMHTQNFFAVWVATKILFRDRFKYHLFDKPKAWNSFNHPIFMTTLELVSLNIN